MNCFDIMKEKIVDYKKDLEQKLREADEKYSGDEEPVTDDEETNSQDASPVG